ncbi:MAG: kinase/pyrophosphorylase [Gammaproteobacteria bacterium]|nr:kinase/pyrophosphorylase [Gammaproteobacteria bacterium]
MRRSVFFISDRTGITAEKLSQTLLSQFEQIEFDRINLPFIDTEDKAKQAVKQINQTATKDGNSPLLFCTLVDDNIRKIINNSEGVSYDFFGTFIKPLEKELGVSSNHVIGRSHGQGQEDVYKTRIDAVNFALHYDDGRKITNLENTDIILVGVSRSGKTPTCLYMAMHYGLMAANYPMLEEDLRSPDLPHILQPHREKLFGLTINPQRLQQIRSERRPNSDYASLKQCQFEVRSLEHLFDEQKIPYIDTSAMSIEEICTSIMQRKNLKRQLEK